MERLVRNCVLEIQPVAHEIRAAWIVDNYRACKILVLRIYTKIPRVSAMKRSATTNSDRDALVRTDSSLLAASCPNIAFENQDVEP